MRRALGLLMLFAAVALAAPAAGAAATTPRVPQGWVGMNVNGFALYPAFPIESQMQDMVTNGVDTVLTQVPWATMQPDAGDPIDWTQTDRVALTAARLKMTWLPVVVFAPNWAGWVADSPTSAPQPDKYAVFFTALVKRYGPGGSFWAAHPEVAARPVRAWQVWNEPSLYKDWRVCLDGVPDRHASCAWQWKYVRVLKAARTAIKAADPKAKIVLAALPNFSWKDLESLYRMGLHGLYDVLSLHPYTGLPENVVKIVDLNRAVMRKHGDRRLPVMVSELNRFPPTDPGDPKKFPQKYPPKLSVGTFLKRALPLLAQARQRDNISMVAWFTWASSYNGTFDPFEYTGLRMIETASTTRDLPELAMFRAVALRLQGCRAQGPAATDCRR